MELIDASTIGYGGNYIAYRPDATQPYTVLNKTQIKEIKGNFTPNYQNVSTGNHGFVNRCHINITLQNGNTLDFDVQDITTQPTWAVLGGTVAAIDLAIKDISNW